MDTKNGTGTARAAVSWLRQVPPPVWVSLTAAAILIGHAVMSADEWNEAMIVSAAIVLLVTGHALLGMRARAMAAESEATRAHAELQLRSAVGDCEARQKSLAAFVQIASHVAHEVRNPLGSIILNVELMDEEVAHCKCERKAEKRELLASIRREAERLHGLTDEYLAFARPPRPAVGRHSVNAIVDDIGHQIREEAARLGIEVDTRLAHECPAVRIDPQQMTQATWNLVRNAMQAMPNGGRLLLESAVDPDGSTRLTVEDTGPGIPAHLRCQVLEPFFTTKRDGTGLGLSLASHVIRDHGGELVIDQGEAGGARVTLRLPFSPQEPGGAIAAATACAPEQA